MVKILLTILLSCLSGVLYRMGGSDTYNSKWRDWGCSIVTLLVFYLLGQH